MAFTKAPSAPAALGAKRPRAATTSKKPTRGAMDAQAFQAAVHPAWRTCLLVWALTRPLWWIAAGLRAGAPALPAPTGGGPLWMALQAMAPTPWALAGLCELAMLGALLSIWSLARRDGLPQTAERATWLWAICPLMIWTTPGNAWTLAAACALGALATAQQGRHLLALGLIGAASSCRPETLVLAPALAWLGWRAYHPGRDEPWAPWALTLGPWAIGAMTILVALGFGGAFGISLRHLPMTPWGLPNPAAFGPAELGLSLAAGACLLLAARFATITPGAWWAALLPCLLWPFVHAPSVQATPLWLAAFPAFVYMAKIAEDAAVERALLVVMTALGLVMTLQGI
jgi:hypothetical protein